MNNNLVLKQYVVFISRNQCYTSTIIQLIKKTGLLFKGINVLVDFT